MTIITPNKKIDPNGPIFYIIRYYSFHIKSPKAAS